MEYRHLHQMHRMHVRLLVAVVAFGFAHVPVTMAANGKLLGCAYASSYQKKAGRGADWAGYRAFLAGPTFDYSKGRPETGPYFFGGDLGPKPVARVVRVSTKAAREKFGRITTISAQSGNYLSKLTVRHGTGSAVVAGGCAGLWSSFSVPEGQTIQQVRAFCSTDARTKGRLKALEFVLSTGAIRTLGSKSRSKPCGAQRAPAQHRLAYFVSSATVQPACKTSWVAQIALYWTPGANPEICANFCFRQRNAHVSQPFDRRLIASSFPKAPALVGTEAAHGCWCSRNLPSPSAFVSRTGCPASTTVTVRGKRKTTPKDCPWKDATFRLKLVRGVNMSNVFYYNPAPSARCAPGFIRAKNQKMLTYPVRRRNGRPGSCGALQPCTFCRNTTNGNCVNNAFRRRTGQSVCLAWARSCEHNGEYVEPRNPYEHVFDLNEGCRAAFTTSGGARSVSGAFRWRGLIIASNRWERAGVVLHDKDTAPVDNAPRARNAIKVLHFQDCCVRSMVNRSRFVNGTSMKIEIITKGVLQYSQVFSLRSHPSYPAFGGQTYQQVWVHWTPSYVMVQQYAQQLYAGTRVVVIRAGDRGVGGRRIALPRVPLQWSWGTISSKRGGGNDFVRPNGDEGFYTIMKSDEAVHMSCSA